MGIIHAYVVRILYFRASLLSQINILLWSHLVKEFYLFFLKKRKETKRKKYSLKSRIHNSPYLASMISSAATRAILWVSMGLS